MRGIVMLRKLLPAMVVLFGLAVPASSLAQATRTWVSGVGDDANPCSRTAPCKTFAGAISKTAVGGEIDALDPGGFGAVTITHAITIDGGGGQVASVLVSGTNGIVVDAGAADHVILRNLRITGLDGAGLSGVDFIAGGGLRLENDQIFGFGDSGVTDTSPNSSLVVSGSNIDDNTGDGVLVAPPAGSSAQALLEDDSLENNECGVAAGALGGPGPFTTNCGLSSSGTPASGVDVSVDHSSASANAAAGVMSLGAPSTVFLSTATVFGNHTGLAPVNGGSIVSVGPNNAVYGNGGNGSPTATSGPQDVQGPQGPPGAQGAAGQPGQVILITCQTTTRKTKVHGKTKTTTTEKCKARPITGTVTFTVSSHLVRATLSRAGHVDASGEMGGSRGYLRLSARLRPARYILTLWRGHRAVSRRSVVLS
jgi:hypothetical protein